MSIRITWFATASVSLETARGRLLFDPFLPLDGAEHTVDISAYDGYSDILVTHGHVDHIAHIPAILRRNPGTRVWCTAAPFRTLRRKGVPRERLMLLHPGESFRLNGFDITTYAGKHAVLPRATSGRVKRILRSGRMRNLFFLLWEMLCCPEKGETLFYEIKFEGRSVQLMGSLNLREDTDYPTQADLLVLPCNGWEDIVPPVLSCMERLSPKRVLPDHWDISFPPLTQPVDLQPVLQRYGDLITLVPPRSSIEL